MPQPHKGERRARTIRFPLPLNSTIEEAAEQAGYGNVSDYVVAVMDAAIAAGVHPQPKVTQEPLSISA